MVTDKNKNIATIEYNHLNLPAIVTKDDGQYVKYIYNAAGVKVSQEVYDSSDELKKKTDYLGEFFYENDTLKFVNHEEGRIVMTGINPEYQYTLKDHLGNTRITFTAKHEVETFTATMDASSQEEEEEMFGAYNSVTMDVLDPTPQENGEDKIRVLNGSSLEGSNNGQVGLTKTFAVLPGDVITASVNAKYLAGGGSADFIQFAASLMQAFNVTPSKPFEGLASFEALNEFLVAIPVIREEDEELPKGFINILVFDKDYELIDFDFAQVGEATMLTASVEIRQPGYVYVFLSNDGADQMQIGFDNYSISHEHSDVIQQDDYYPFGLTFNSYQRENSTKNNYLYNDNEVQDELDLELMDFNARFYDPSIGRFIQVDDLADFATDWTPYRFGFNNPIRFSDPLGLYEGEEGSWKSGDEGFSDVLSYFGIGNSNASQNSSDGGCPPGSRCETDKDGHTSVYDDDGNVIRVIPARTQRDDVDDAIKNTGDLLKMTGMAMGEEAAYMVVGGTIFKLVFKGGKWVVKSVRAYNASRNASKLGIRAIEGGLEGSVKLGDNIIDYGVEATSQGSTLFISEIALYARGATGTELAGKVGSRAGLLVKKSIIEWAKGQKYTKIAYQYSRSEGSSSAKKGSRAIEIIELN